MGTSKVILNDEVLIDLSADTVTEDSVAKGRTFHKANGEPAIGTGIGITLNGIIHNYQVNAGAKVSAGDFVEFVNKWGTGEFHTGTTNYISACKLDNNRVLIAYQDKGNKNNGEAVVLAIDDTSISIGEAVVFHETISSEAYAAVEHVSVVALTENKCLVVFAHGTKSSPNTNPMYYVKGIALTIDDMAISITSEEYMIGGGSSVIYSVSSAALTDNKALVAWGNSGYDGYSAVITTDGTTIKGGARVGFYNGYSDKTSCTMVSVTALTDTKAVIGYIPGKGCRAIVAAIDGSVVSYGSYYQYTGGGDTNTTRHDVCVSTISEDKVLFSQRSRNTATQICDELRIYLIGVNGTSLRSIATGIIQTDGSYEKSFHSALTEDKILLSYNGEMRIITINEDDTMSIGEPIIFNPSADGKSSSGAVGSIIPFSANNALVIYNGNLIGKYASLSITDDMTITVDDISGGTLVQPTTSKLYNVGVAKTSGTEGEVVEVYCTA